MREAPPDYDGALLEVSDLRTHFLTPRGPVRAVDGVSLSLDRGVTLGVVGESGSGKTILARSIMNLLPRENPVCVVSGRAAEDMGDKVNRGQG